MNSDGAIDRALARAAERAATGQAPLVAGVIRAWHAAFPDAEPREALGCSERLLTELAFCRRPRPRRWVEDAAEIAADLGIDLDRLIAFMRAGEAVERISAAHLTGDSQAGSLLAARDRDEE